MYYEGRTTDIPSQVVRLPPPLLTPSAGWTSVQPSPDRTSVLLRGLHECQLIRLPDARAVPFTNQKNNNNNNYSSAAQDSTRVVVLPQPHRRLTSACWMSSGVADTAPPEAAVVVALGDAQSVVSVVRATHSSGNVEWMQTTIFLHDAHDRLFTADADTSSSKARPSFYTPSWKAVSALVPSHHPSTFRNGGDARAGTSAALAAYIICQRCGEERYRGDGAADTAARTTTHGLWMASVERARAWVVPLTMPDEDNGGGGEGIRSVPPNGEVAGEKAEDGRGLRILDVHPRVSQGGADEGPSQSSHHNSPSRRIGGGAGPTAGRVFAAASRRHVGLFTMTTVKPTVFFRLPTQGLASCRHGSWAVTSVLEAPPSAFAAQLDSSADVTTTLSENSYAYLIAASRAGAGQLPALTGTARCEKWWLLYDCRKPSAPVWAALAPDPCSYPSTSATAADAPSAAAFRDGRHWEEEEKACDMTEWLCSAAPTTVSAPSPLCVSYLPCAETRAKNECADGNSTTVHSSPPSAGVCVLLNGGAGSAAGVGAEEMDASPSVKRGRTDAPRSTLTAEHITTTYDATPAPLLYELAPPPSLATVMKDSTCRVRALCYRDNVLSYLCASR